MLLKSGIAMQAFIIRAIEDMNPSIWRGAGLKT
jgi:hypothetical protein